LIALGFAAIIHLSTGIGVTAAEGFASASRPLRAPPARVAVEIALRLPLAASGPIDICLIGAPRILHATCRPGAFRLIRSAFPAALRGRGAIPVRISSVMSLAIPLILFLGRRVAFSLFRLCVNRRGIRTPFSG
jgi:hypothetical protein